MKSPSTLGAQSKSRAAAESAMSESDSMLAKVMRFSPVQEAEQKIPEPVTLDDLLSQGGIGQRLLEEISGLAKKIMKKGTADGN